MAYYLDIGDQYTTNEADHTILTGCQEACGTKEINSP